MARRPFQGGPPKKRGPRVNQDIVAESIRVVGEDGEMLGVMSVEDALDKADAVALDLVEISPNSDPPVCKILDYGKFKYQAQKKAAEARKKQKTVDVKEIKMRPSIERHDYDVKMRAINKFLDEGDKVKVTIRFRGREFLHQELGMQMLERVRGELEEKAKVEALPKMEGRQMVMVVAPR
ncbi:MAG: translation initiation factor IF-3 [Alphaproteobacteria bacterium]|nr:translation initiation factor IF-3 [Alphaproteobacteria bacterium]MCZ6495853.1 translation initiation factor IF-3 [Alphaproteobacteria bacterium]MCZ6608382.1 translation initiation factor IF-3 [Alphaproteobacteria bacterium]MCZ6742213.1 translation initiation factor IF-3 [Alphaproteobacteria bacterium]MCZ6813115.1 translation initiation factor IF-3 [Alphaproteobacteria bacterium]